MHAKLLSGGQDGATHNRLGAAGLEDTGGSGRPGCGAGGRRRGLAGQRVDVPPHKAPQALPVWRAPEGPEGRAAVPVGGGGAWLRCPWAAAGPGCDARGRRQGLVGQRVDAPSEARGADDPRAGRRPRAHQAARLHTSTPSSPAPQPGPPPPGTPAASQATLRHQRPHTAKPPSPAGAGRLNQYQRIIEESRQYRDYRDRFPGVRSRYRASRRCPWRCLPSGDPRRRR